jgi:hypothetical protein
MFCETCGKELPSRQSSFCPYCGSKVTNQPNPISLSPTQSQPLTTQPNKKSASSKRPLVPILIVIFALLGASATVLVLKFSPFKSASRNAEKILPKQASAIDMHQYFKGYSSSLESSSAANNAFWSNVEYSIDEINYTDDTSGIAYITLTTPKVSSILNEMFEYCASNENLGKSQQELSAELQTMMVERLSKNTQTASKEIEMEIVKVDETWQLIPNSEWKKSVLGEADNVFSDYLSQYLDGVINQVAGRASQ